MLEMISVFLNLLLGLVSCPNTWSLLENVTYPLENMCPVALGWKVLYISIKPVQSDLSFKASVPVSPLRLGDLAIGGSGVLTSATVIAGPSVSPLGLSLMAAYNLALLSRVHIC